MRLSVLILTSPGREDNLRACLQALKQQRHQDFELIVIDDGSPQGEAVLAAETSGWRPARYLWRPNDYCMSRSYNLGAEQVMTDHLVMLSADVLLNPLALTAYAASLMALPDTVIYGYFGSDKRDERPSCLIPGRRVNLRDERFAFGPDGGLRFQPQMRQYPQHFAWGGNWALPKALFDALGGMDEGYSGWGLEDVDFANRLLERRGRLAFSLDVWGEHQVHPLDVDEARYASNKARLGTYWIAVNEPGLIYDPASNKLREGLMDEWT